MRQQPNGIHHIAFMAGDIKKHIAFFSEVLGFPLVALFDMHGVPGGLHAFLPHERLRVLLDRAASRRRRDSDRDRPLPRRLRAPCPRPRARCSTSRFGPIPKRGSSRCVIASASHGINVIGPIDHGMCRSIYFGGPRPDDARDRDLVGAARRRPTGSIPSCSARQASRRKKPPASARPRLVTRARSRNRPTIRRSRTQVFRTTSTRRCSRCRTRW